MFNVSKIENEITYTIKIHPEDIPLEGNVMCSDDDEYDRQCEDKIRKQLEYNELAWCTIEVVAEFRGITESDYLGCCSYESLEQFKSDGYYDDMKYESKRQLIETLADIYKGLEG